MKRVIAYCRSACEPQGAPSAVRRQARTLRRYAKERGLTIRTIYMDRGVSGCTLDRPELQRLIADCRAGRIGTVITQDPDRLSRDSGQLIALLHIFQTEGVRVEFSSPEGERHLAFLAHFLSALTELDEARPRNTANGGSAEAA